MLQSQFTKFQFHSFAGLNKLRTLTEKLLSFSSQQDP